MTDETKTTAAPTSAPAEEGKTPETTTEAPTPSKLPLGQGEGRSETKEETGSAAGPTAEELAAAEAAKEDEEIAKRKGKLVGADELKAGMTVRVHERIKDISPKGEERERVQIFQGIILGLRGAGASRTMTVRRLSKGFGVEKIYPLRSPNIVRVEVVKIADVRRAKLGFLGDLKNRFRRKLKETWVE